MGALAHILFLKIDKSIRSKKIIDLAGEIGVAIFAGDQPFVEGTPIGDALCKALNRLGFILNIIESKLSKDGRKVDLKTTLLNTVGNNKGFSDNNSRIDL